MLAPPGIRAIWDKYCHRAPDLVPFIQKAYANAVSDEDEMLLPHGMELEDADHFLRYYGLIPPNKDGADFLRVPKDGPAAIFLKSKVYPLEAKKVKVVRNELITSLERAPRRLTYFVFGMFADNARREDILRRNSVHEGEIVLVQYGPEMRDSVIRSKLISHLTEVDRLEAEFVQEEALLVDPGEQKIPAGRKKDQTLLVVGTQGPPEEDLQFGWTDDDNEDRHKHYYRIFDWRYVLRVRIPDV